jgi:hypothetical protein
VIYLVLGRRELGKTTLADYMIKSVAKRVVIDPRRMIRQRDRRIEYVSTVEEFEDATFEMMTTESNVHEVVYQPIEDDLEISFVRWTRAIKRAIMAFPNQQIGVLVDEASFYNLNAPTFQWLLKCVPRDQAYIVITAHQPKDVPTNVRAIADHWFMFRMTQQTDLDKVSEKSPEAATLAKTLRDRAFVHWDDTTARLSVNARSSSWYVPLSE